MPTLKPTNRRLIQPGCSLRKALRLAERMGCTIVYPRRTGEVVVHPPLVELHRVRVNARRRDASLALVGLLLDLSAFTAG